MDNLPIAASRINLSSLQRDSQAKFNSSQFLMQKSLPVRRCQGRDRHIFRVIDGLYFKNIKNIKNIKKYISLALGQKTT
jgi:hypothetical protein